MAIKDGGTAMGNHGIIADVHDIAKDGHDNATVFP